MAQQLVLIDDLDGTLITSGNGGHVTFALNGQSYAIDLSDTNQQKLAAALKPFIDVATKKDEGDPEVTRLHLLAEKRKREGKRPLILASEARAFLKEHDQPYNKKGPLQPKHWEKFRELCRFDNLELGKPAS